MSATKPVTAICVTLMLAKPDDFVRFGQVATPAFLWLQRQADAPAITDVKILYGQEACPEGYTKVEESLSATGEPVYLATEIGGTGENSSAIMELKIVTSDNMSVPVGFQRLERELNPASTSEAKEYLCFQSATTLEALNNKEYAIGEQIDCKDTYNTWLGATVIDKRSEPTNQIKVNYIGYTARWDEWVDVGAVRLAPFKTKSVRADGSKPPFPLNARWSQFSENSNHLREMAAKIADQSSITQEQLEFIIGENATFLRGALNARVDNEEVMPEVVNFFTLNIQVLIQAIREPAIDHKAMQLLCDIFGASPSRFYRQYGSGDIGTDGKFSIRSRDTPPISGYLVGNLNKFGELGGFDLIRSRILDSNETFNTIGKVLRLLAFTSRYLATTFSEGFVSALGLDELIRGRISRITDVELKQMDKTTFDNILHDFRVLAENAGIIGDTAAVIDLLQLTIALRLLNARVLEKRVNGLDTLANACKPLAQRATGPAVLVDWLVENKIVSLVFAHGEPHHEMVRRSTPVLQFLARHRALSADMIGMLWTAASSSNEDVSRAGYTVYADLAKDMSVDELDVLFDRLSQTPFSQMRAFDLEFIKSFTQNAKRQVRFVPAGSTVPTKWYGLDIFWQILQEEKEVSSDILTLAATILTDLLREATFVSQRPVYLTKCVEGLREGKAVVQCIEMCKSILLLYHQKNMHIQSLETDHSILSLLLNDIVKFQEQKHDDLKLHDENLGKRLDFLEFLLSSSALLLTDEMVALLWDAFVIKQHSVKDQAKFLTWLGSAVQSKQPAVAVIHGAVVHYPSFSFPVIENTFTTYMCEQLNPVSLDEKGFTTFARYMTHINCTNQRLWSAEITNPVVSNFNDLVGLDPLWQVALYSQDVKVLKEARTFLVSLYVRVDYRTSEPEKQVVWRAFVDKCMTFLVPESSDQVLLSVLAVLTQFVQKFEAGEIVYPPQFAVGDPVKAKWKKNDSRYDARVRIVHGDGTYDILFKDNDQDGNCPEHWMTHTSEAGKQRAQLRREAVTEHFFARTILANEDAYFNGIFNLLENVNPQVSQDTWKLLSILPHNDSLSQQVNAIGSENPPDLKTLLPSTSTTQLLYTTQLLEAALTPPTSDVKENTPLIGQETDSKHLALAQAFVQTGGYGRLYSLFVRTQAPDLRSRGLLQQQVVLQLLRVLLGIDQILQMHEGLSVYDDAVLMPLLVDMLHVMATLDFDVKADKTSQTATIQAELVSQLFRLLIARAEANPAVLSTLYSSPVLSDLVIGGLVRHHNKEVRKEMTNSINNLCSSSTLAAVQDPRSVFLPLLLSCMDTMAEGCTPDFFALLRTLVQGGNLDAVEGVNPASLVFNLVAILDSYVGSEKNSSSPDELMRGLLGLVRELLVTLPELKEEVGQSRNLIHIVHQYLFEKPAPNLSEPSGVLPPKCKTRDSRALGYALLTELAQGCPTNAAALVRLISPNHLHPPGKNTEWQFESKSEEKSSAGYVGLKNLGSICYMNSTMQQLYMIPHLRKRLLQVDEYGEKGEEGVMYQFQYLLAFLQQSERQFFTPRNFCSAFNINTAIQEDASDFLNRFIDNIDTTLKDSKHKNVLASTLRGLYCHQTIGRGECTHYRERTEDYYSVPLPIQNKKTLQESLEAFIEPDASFTGDNKLTCDECGCKVPAVKRTCFKTLPPTILFVLRRFALDYTTWETKKLNDRLEFPMDIDLRPFTAEGVPSADGKVEGKGESKGVVRPNGYYNYMLRGVVVHMGTVAQGHYYSLVHERLPGGDAEGNWLELNDDRVKVFDKTKLAEECFGGNDAPVNARRTYGGFSSVSYGSTAYGSDSMYGDSVYGNTRSGKSKNAYILVYDRKRLVDDDAPEEDNTENKCISFQAAGFVMKAFLRFRTLLRGIRSRVAVPPHIFQQVWQENVTYWENKAIFDPTYFQFVRDLVETVPLPDEKESDVQLENKETKLERFTNPEGDTLLDQITLLATRFVLWTLSRAKAKDALPEWTTKLGLLYRSNVKASVNLLDTLLEPNNTWTFDFLLSCRDKGTSKAVGDIICSVLSAVAPLELDLISESKGLVIQYLDRVLSLIALAPSNWKTFTNYWHVISHISGLNPLFAHYLLQHGMVAKLIDFFLGDDSPHPEVNDLPLTSQGKRIEIGSKWVHPDWKYFLQLFENLVLCCLPAGADQPLPPTLVASGFQLPDMDLEMLLSKVFLERFVAEAVSRTRGQSVCSVINHLVHENKELSVRLISYITVAIDSLPYDKMRPYFRVLMSLVLLQDSLTSQRIEWILSSLIDSMEEQQTYWKATDFCIDHLIRMAKKSPGCYAWLQANSAKFDWMLNWLFMYKVPTFHAGMKTYKENRTTNHYGGNYVALAPSGIPCLQKKDFLDACKEQKEPLMLTENDGDDSDFDLQDRILTVNQRVDVQEGLQWRLGTVIGINNDRVHINVDGYGPESNQWMDMSSPRLMEEGYHTNRPPPPLPSYASVATGAGPSPITSPIGPQEMTSIPEDLNDISLDDVC
jgi:ubiquitin C-terminal hydrolase